MAKYVFCENKCKHDVDFAIANAEYSSEEQQIGFWFGKPLYRKTYNFIAEKDGDDYYKQITTYEENNIDILVNIDGFGIYQESNAWRKIGASEFPDAEEITRFYTNGSDIAFQCTSFSEDINVYATIEYTKTID